MSQELPAAIQTPLVRSLLGDEEVAYRDPAVVLHDGVFYLYYTYIRHDPDGTPYWSLGESRSRGGESYRCHECPPGVDR